MSDETTLKEDKPPSEGAEGTGDNPPLYPFGDAMGFRPFGRQLVLAYGIYRTGQYCQQVVAKVD